MKKQLRKAMICTIAMMLVAVVTLTGVTYAWFSESNAAVVDGVTIDVVTKAGGVLMAKVANPGENGWSYHVGLGWTTKDFVPASTTPSNLDSNKNLVFYDGVLDDSNLNMVTTTKLATTTNSTQGAHYFKHDLYFWNPEDKAVPVKLDVTPGDGAIWQSVRIALVNHGTYTVTTETDSDGKVTEKVNVTEDANGVQAMIYEFKPKDHHRTGSTDYINTYGVISEGTNVLMYGEIKDEDGNVTKTGEITKLENDSNAKSQYVELVDSYFAGHGTRTNPNFEIPKNSYFKVTVYIWLEGQDVDCLTEVAGSRFEPKLNFTRTDIQGQ